MFWWGFIDADGRDKPGRYEYQALKARKSQLASASSESCRGVGSVWFWSVSGVG